MRTRFFFLPLFVLFICISYLADAQGWSYIYIQGDKQIPFYVKLEGEMLPRYSKNYCIIPQLEAGPVHIQILFQQNQYPPQHFTVQVPEDGQRGFLLTRKEDAFALYDVQQHFYLMPGEAGEDHLPQIAKAPPKEVADVVTGAVEASTQPDFMPDVELRNEHTATTAPPLQRVSTPAQTVSPPAQPKQQSTPEKSERVNIAEEQTVEEMSRQQPRRAQPVKAAPQETVIEKPIVKRQTEEAIVSAPVNEGVQDPGVKFGQQLPSIVNSDCPEPLDDTRFDVIYNATIEKKGDDKRILYLMKRISGNCFTTRQAAVLASKLSAESLRYSFLKKVYPRIVDQQYFPQLDQLFKTVEWKSYFRLIQ